MSIRIWENKKVLVVCHEDFFVFPLLIFNNNIANKASPGLFCFPWENKKVLVTYHRDFFVFPRKIFKMHTIYPLYCQVININPENASSRKLGNQNWFSQPLVHTVMGRTRALRALVLAHNCMNSWLGKPSSSFPTSWKRYIFWERDSCHSLLPRSSV